MTPKEKGEELVDKFKLKHKFFTNSFIKTTAKECALIAVDEIIESNPISFDKDDNCIAKQWWKEVKAEIQKL